MHASEVEGVEFIIYQLKDVAYQVYEVWEHLTGDEFESTLWDNFSSPFLDYFFPQKCREVKVKKFVNSKQGKIIIKE